MSKHRIKVCTTDGIWLIGTIDDIDFWVKVCDEPSGFGIGGGRVIKLHLRTKFLGRELFAYERGWDKPPRTPEHEALLKAMLLFCEELPTQKQWRHSMRRIRTFVIDDEAGTEK